MHNVLNYYELLGVQKNTSLGEIKKNYRRLARQYHPDLNPKNKESEEKFKAIVQAYQVLSNPNSRAKYDQFGRDSNPGKLQGRLTRQLPSQQKSWDNCDSDGYISTNAGDWGFLTSFNHFFDRLVGLGCSKTTSRGSITPASTRRDRFRPGTTKTSYVVLARTSHQDLNEQMTISLFKASWGGSARIRLSDGRSLEVNMPAAIVTDQRLYFKGLGLDGGNLYLTITVEPHPFWHLEGTDIHCRLPITPNEAVFGGAVEVPTLKGRMKMILPPRVKSGQRLRLASLGYPDSNGRLGDMVVELQIVVLRNFSAAQRK